MKYLPIILLFISTSILAQRKDRMDKLKAYRTAFFTEQLDLSPKEAEKFWPVFNEFSKEMRNLKRQVKKELHKNVEALGDAITEEQANDLIAKKIEFSRKELELENQLINDLKAFFPSTKIIQVFRVEEQFRRKLLERYRGKRK